MAERWREVPGEGVLVSSSGRLAHLVVGTRETAGRYLALAYHGPQPADKKLEITSLTPKGCRWVKWKFRPKLSAGEVRQIRAELAAGAKMAKVAQRFGITAGLVSRIRSGKVWRNV